MPRAKRNTALSFMSDRTQQRALADESDIIHRLSLNDIRPDARQPRHLLPADLAERLYTGDIPPLIVLKALVERSNTDEKIKETVVRIADLAQDIKENELINPITVREVQNGLTKYLIETGERRYWAHWYLVFLGSDEFRQIRALMVEDKNTRLRQLSENINRDGLTAVETAIGLALLIVELEENDLPEWYENKTILDPLLRKRAMARLTRGTWPKIVEKLGYSVRHWRHYLDLLKLCDEALELAHENRLTEGQLRTVVTLTSEIEQVAEIKRIIGGKEKKTSIQKATRKKHTRQREWLQSMDKLHHILTKSTDDDIDMMRIVIAGDNKRKQTFVELKNIIDKILTD